MKKVLSDGQLKFFSMLESESRISHLWDQEQCEIKQDLFESEMGVMSPSEVHLARFFAAIWFGNSDCHGFDLVRAMASLDEHGRSLISKWASDPFFP